MSYEEKRRAREEATFASQEKLNEAFKLLRKEGLIARQRFSCCRGCAGCEIADEVSGKVDAGKKLPKGAVFYTRQGGFWGGSTPGSRFARPTKCYLSFGNVSTSKHGDIGLPTVEVGKLICKVLDKVGLHYEWDGTEDQCIMVDPCPGLWNEVPRTRLERVA